MRWILACAVVLSCGSGCGRARWAETDPLDFAGRPSTTARALQCAQRVLTLEFLDAVRETRAPLLRAELEKIAGLEIETVERVGLRVDYSGICADAVCATRAYGEMMSSIEDFRGSLEVVCGEPRNLPGPTPTPTPELPSDPEDPRQD